MTGTGSDHAQTLVEAAGGDSGSPSRVMEDSRRRGAHRKGPGKDILGRNRGHYWGPLTIRQFELIEYMIREAREWINRYDIADYLRYRSVESVTKLMIDPIARGWIERRILATKISGDARSEGGGRGQQVGCSYRVTDEGHTAYQAALDEILSHECPPDPVTTTKGHDLGITCTATNKYGKPCTQPARYMHEEGARCNIHHRLRREVETWPSE